MKPTVRRLEEEYFGRVEFRALNVDDAVNDAAKEQYRFIGQPQFVVLKPDGTISTSRNGTSTYDRLKADIELALASQ
jgi:hypothetical protein